MSKAKALLQNLVLNYRYPIYTVEDGIKQLKGKENALEAIHIYIENSSPKTWEPKNIKKYFDISKVDILSRLDEWVFDNLIDQNEYANYLEKYLPLKQKLHIADIDEYILDKHYRPKAIKTLQQTKKNFDLEKWRKKRFKYNYARKTNLLLKDGTQFRFDFRNFLESFFILKENNDKLILAIGGSGSSHQREQYTKFTAIFYLLGKKHPITHYIVKYTAFNQFKYFGSFTKPIITFDLGSNYSLDPRFREEIRKHGIDLGILIKNEALHHRQTKIQRRTSGKA